MQASSKALDLAAIVSGPKAALSAQVVPTRSCLEPARSRLVQASGQMTPPPLRRVRSPTHSPRKRILTYQIIWSSVLPKTTVKDFSFELPPPKGNVIAGSFSLRGDGTWNKIN